MSIGARPLVAGPAEDAQSDTHIAVRIAATVWWNLPLLLAVDLILLLGALPAVVAVVVTPVAAPLVAALTVGPLWTATIALTDRLWTGRAGSLPLFFRLVWRHGCAGIALSLVPAAVVTMLLGTLRIMEDHPDQRWLLLPLLLDGTALVLVMLAGFAVASLAAATRRRGKSVWRDALVLVAARPAATISIVTLLVVIGTAVRFLGPVFVVTVMAPVAVVLSATTWETLRGWPVRAMTIDTELSGE